MSRVAVTRHTKNEIDWIYMARALCVMAVVAYHVHIWHFASLEPASESIAGFAWEQISRLLGSLRMPLLLMVSGVLAAQKISGISPKSPWRWSATNYYLYVNWLVVYAVLGMLLASTSHPNFVSSIPDLAIQLVSPNTSLWYIFALAIYAPLLVAVRAVPVWLVISILAVLNVALATFGPDEETMLLKAMRLFVFFAIGVYGRDIFIVAGEANPLALAVAGTLTGAASFYLSALPMHDLSFETLYLFRSLAVGCAMVGISALIVKAPMLLRGSRLVGRRALGIYVMHPPLIVVGSLALQKTDLSETVASSDLLGLLYPVAFTAICVILAITIEVALKSLRLNFLFDMPAALSPRRQ